jgi:hypothetical protein
MQVKNQESQKRRKERLQWRESRRLQLQFPLKWRLWAQAVVSRRHLVQTLFAAAKRGAGGPTATGALQASWTSCWGAAEGDMN